MAAVGAFFTNDLRALYQRAIVNQRCAAFTARGVVFGFMEAEAANMADSAERPAFIGRHHALSSILHHKQIMLAGDSHNGVHLAGHAGVVDRYNRAGFLGDGRFNQRFIDIHGIATNINEDDFRAAQHKGVGGGDEGIARHNHFIARLNIQQQRGHFQRSGAGWRQQRFRGAETLLHPLLAAAGKTAIAAQLAAPHRGLHIIKLGTHHRRRVKWNHHVTCITSTRCFRHWHR